MKKRLLSLLSVLLVATLLTSPVSAGRGIGFSGVQFSLGSLIASGDLVRLGPTDVTVVLDASGIPAITCINNGGNTVPGQSSPKISASGSQSINHTNIDKNGRAPFTTETVDPETLPWNIAGCPNFNWIGHIDFIFWTEAILTVHLGFNNPNGEVLASQKYACVTTHNPDSVSCTPVP